MPSVGTSDAPVPGVPATDRDTSHSDDPERLHDGAQRKEGPALAPHARRRAAPGGGAALGTSRIVFPTLSEAEIQARRGRYERRSQSSRWLIADAMAEAGVEELSEAEVVDESTGEVLPRRWVRPPRPARCSWRIGENVNVHADAGRAHFSGTERCGSIWACPVCAAVIRAERAREIMAAVDAHHAQGGSALFVTLTIKHKRQDALKQSLDAVLGGWRKLLQGRAWVGGRNKSGLRDRYGIQGYIRSTEVTYGDNGWHPHIHAIILTENELTDAQAQTFGDEIHGRWSDAAEKITGRRPDRAHGIDVQKIDPEGQVIGQYLSKVQDEGKKWGVGAELARTDVKTGRGGQSRVPHEFLDDDDENFPAARRRRLWAEYVRDTKGRRAITWSKGLKDRYDIQEREDDDILEETESATVRWVAYGKGYDRLRRSRDKYLLPMVLEAAEREDWETVGTLLPGYPLNPDGEADALDRGDSPVPPGSGSGVTPQSPLERTP